MGKHDLSGKRLIEKQPEQWVRWIFNDPELRVIELVSEQLQFIGRETDIVLKVEKNGELFLVHIEMQYKYDASMPVRVFAYNGLTREKYTLPVISVVVYIKKPAEQKQILTQYHDMYQGMTAHLDFHVIRLWEVDARQVLAEGWDNLLPFIPIMDNVNEEMVVEASHRINTTTNDFSMQTILRLYATIKFGKKQTAKLLGVTMLMIDDLIKDSPILREELIEEGREEGLETAILRIVQRRFGRVPDEMAQLIGELNGEQLDALLDPAIFLTTIEEVAVCIDELRQAQRDESDTG